jgi:hypothetical protein
MTARCSRCDGAVRNVETGALLLHRTADGTRRAGVLQYRQPPPAEELEMSIVYAELRLGNAAGPDVEEITVTGRGR